MSVFFGEVKPHLQVGFAHQFNITEQELVAAAKPLQRIQASPIRSLREQRIVPGELGAAIRVACSLIRQANSRQLVIDHWTFGGGTAMMLRIESSRKPRHRYFSQ